MRNAIFSLLLAPTLLIAAPVPKGADEAAKANLYKQKRQQYEDLLNSLPPKSIERHNLEKDLYLAKCLADRRFGAEQIVDESLKAQQLKLFDKHDKPMLEADPRLKELYDLYYYERSQKT